MPNRDDVRRAFDVIKRYADYEYFFSSLTSAKWIAPLTEENIFDAPPEPEGEDGFIRFPVWPASRYLIRMAGEAPGIVMDAIMRVPKTDNVRVHEDFVSASMKMPASIGKRIVPAALSWLEETYQLLLPQQLGELMALLAQQGEAAAALDLAKGLLGLRGRSGDNSDDSGWTPPLAPKFEEWRYEQILEKQVPVLVEMAGPSALELLCEILASVVSAAGEGVSDDLSYIWRPAIEDHEQNNVPSLRSRLTTAVRNAVEMIAAADGRSLQDIQRILLGQHAAIFHRIWLHILRLHPEPALIARALTDRRYFATVSLRHEYALLLKQSFATLSTSEREAILSWVEEGIDPELIRHNHAEQYGQEMTNQELEVVQASVRWGRLAPLVGSLPPDWERRAELLGRRFGTLDHPEFPIYASSGFLGDTSPWSEDELRNLSGRHLRKRLAEWAPTAEFGNASRAGLAQCVQTIVLNEPERFAASAHIFRGLRVCYVVAALRGLTTAVRNGRRLRWAPVLDLCEWAFRSSEDEDCTEADVDFYECRSLRDAVASLLHEGLIRRPVTVSPRLGPRLWRLIEQLAEDPSPTPEFELRYGGTNMDPPTISLNTVRGQAIHAAIQYGLWLKRRPRRTSADGAGSLTAVFALLDAHLDPDRDKSLGVRAVYGWYFPMLLYLNRDWATSNLGNVFPSQSEHARFLKAAWGAYLAFTSANNLLYSFEALRGQYEAAVRQFTAEDEDAEHLVNHLVILYLRGQIALSDGGLLGEFFVRAGVKLRTAALHKVGVDLHGAQGDVDPAALGRVQALWEARREVASSPPRSSEEMSEFGWLFASSRLPDDWSLKELKLAAGLADNIEPYHLVLERLAVLAESHPVQVLECLSAMIRMKRALVWPEETRVVVTAALGSGNAGARGQARALINALGAMGEHFLKDLLPLTQAAGAA